MKVKKINNKFTIYINSILIYLLSSVHMSNLFQQFRNGIIKNCQNVSRVFSAIIDKFIIIYLCSNPNLF